MNNNFIEQLRQSAKSTDDVRREYIKEELRRDQELELEKKVREKRLVEFIDKLFSPICDIVQETAIEAVKKAVYKEKGKERILEGRIKIYFPYSTRDDDYNGRCYCCFEKPQIIKSKKDITSVTSNKFIVIDRVLDLSQIKEIIKNKMENNIDGIILKKDACFEIDYYDRQAWKPERYELKFKIIF